MKYDSFNSDRVSDEYSTCTGYTINSFCETCCLLLSVYCCVDLTSVCITN